MAEVKIPGIVVQDVGDAGITPGVQNRSAAALVALTRTRVAAMVRHHRGRHGKEPQRIYLPTKFVDWIHKRWGTSLNFEVPSERVLSPTERDSLRDPSVLIEIVNLEVVRAIRLEGVYDAIRLDTVLQSEEASIRCGHCMRVFSLLMAERWTRVGCQHCGKILLIEWNNSTGEITVYPEEENTP